jgi:hypothetical protein
MSAELWHVSRTALQGLQQRIIATVLIILEFIQISLASYSKLKVYFPFRHRGFTCGLWKGPVISKRNLIAAKSQYELIAVFTSECHVSSILHI